MNSPYPYTQAQLTYERLELTSLKHWQFHPHITQICSVILVATRFAFADLLDGSQRRSVTVTPGFLNNIFRASDYEDDLLCVWREDLTERYGFRPVMVTELEYDLSDDNYALTCDISLKMEDRINSVFLKHNVSAPNFVVNLDCDEIDRSTRSLTAAELHDLQWVELKNSCLWEQLTISQWGEVLDDLRHEFMFVLLRYDLDKFDHY